MKRIARWYDIDVVFKGDLSAVNVVGNYSRTGNLANLLRHIELMEKVDFTVEGRRITVVAK